MGERAVFPGSFRPFHCEHLARVRTILSSYPDQDLIIAVVDECPSPKEYDIICGIDALRIVSLVINFEGLRDHVREEMVAVNSEMPQGICRVFTGSQRTIKILESLKNNYKWDGEIVRLDNSGIHGEDIRRLIVRNDPSWKDYVHPAAIDYIESLSG